MGEYGGLGTSPHPVLAAIDAIRAELSSVAEVPVELLGVAAKEQALVGVAELADRLAGLQLRLLSIAHDVAVEHGARDAGAWLAKTTRADRVAARRDLLLAESLPEWDKVAAALACGAVTKEQARVIVAALDALPAEVGADVLVRAEEHLIELAAEWPPKVLRALGRRILEVVAPEIGEAHEARLLMAEERRADASISLTFAKAGPGRTAINFVGPDAVAHRMRTYLEAFMSPRHEAAIGGAQVSVLAGKGAGEGPAIGSSAERLQTSRKQGIAFLALLESIDPDRIPRHGGDATTVVVTVGLESLRSELGVAGILGTDDRITAGEARRLACTAKIVPAVLGKQSELLDLGRSARLFSAAQRKAMRIRDRKCRAEGCGTAASWCEAHHLRPWSRGGRTDIALGVLLCHFHHRKAHDPAYDHLVLPDGDLRFFRRSRRAVAAA